MPLPPSQPFESPYFSGALTGSEILMVENLDGDSPMRIPLAAVLLVSAMSASHAASFDCAKAVTVEEKTVCADPRLSAMDTLLGRAFVEARTSSASNKRDSAKVMAVARVFLRQRQTCGASRACLIGSYVGALDGYMSAGSSVTIPSWVDAPAIAGGDAPPSRSLPTVPGTCVSTQVAEVHPRLGDGGPAKDEDYDTGTAVEFANGGHQVSYSREAALLGSRRGDQVIMCLISIPQLCPPGDDRGRSYTVTNIRTQQTWTLGDSQHMCGGA